MNKDIFKQHLSKPHAAWRSSPAGRRRQIPPLAFAPQTDCRTRQTYHTSICWADGCRLAASTSGRYLRRHNDGTGVFDAGQEINLLYIPPCGLAAAHIILPPPPTTCGHLQPSVVFRGMASFQAHSPGFARRKPSMQLVLIIPILLLCGLLILNILHLHTTQTQQLLLGASNAEVTPALATRRLSAEAWAGYPPRDVAAGSGEVLKLLNATERSELEDLCGRCLFEQLKMTVGYGNGHKAS